MKSVGQLLLWMLIGFCILVGRATATERKEDLFVIHQIALDPQNPQTLYAATSNYGILKSADGGTTWGLTNQGLRSYTHRAVVINPVDTNILYAGGWGGGVSKSVDRGQHWTEMNDRLGNTAIEDIALDPTHPETLYAATTSGVFRSPDGGGSWMPYSEGLPISEIENFECLLAPPSGPIELLLGTSQGLYKRIRNSHTWEPVKGVIEREYATALAIEPKTGLLLAGTVKHGLLQSRDAGQSWHSLGGKIGNMWISDIALDPVHPGVIYVSTRGNGIFKSLDGGAIWQDISIGLPTQDIRCLGINPKKPEILYAGTTQEGLVMTRNGGRDWVQLTGYPLLSMAEIIASLSIPYHPSDNSSNPQVPPEFIMCNRCHGWTDSRLNSKHTYWRVTPNRRDWGQTVKRMSIRANLTPEESNKIVDFLTRYTMGKQ
jgi:photosystem II stability/assembly factor-like uncharacterized protein